ncbi:tetratricopeptide repeat protein 28-like [Montipora capricornis]|uniref:tetratricopeptide repeat protein 28-like n=1 Tax=Montipora capricornis TaxID=246305 RepID=UPI0035F1D3A1
MEKKTSELIEQHNNELSTAQKEGDRAREAKACCNLGIAYYDIGDFDTALGFFQKDLAITKEMGNRSREAMVYFNLGNVNDGLGRFEEAIECYERCVAIAKEVGDRGREGSAYSYLANLYESLGDIQKAIEYHKKDLAISKESNDKAGEGRACSNLGNCLYSIGRFQEAIEYHKRDLSIAQEKGDKSGEGLACCNLGVALKNVGNFSEALDYHKKDLAIAEYLGDIAGKGRAYGNLGIVCKCLGDVHQAIDYYEMHLSIAKEMGDKAGEARAYGNLGNAHKNLGNYQQAIEYHKKDLSIAKDLGNTTGEARAYGNIGNVYEGLGNFKQAIEFHKRHLEIAVKRGDRAGEGRTYNNLGNAYDCLGDYQEAIKYHQRALAIAKEVGDVASEGRSYSGLGNAYDSLGDFEEAIKYHEEDLSVAKELGDRDGESRAYCNLGIAYRNLGQLQEAINYHKKYLFMCKEADDKAGEGKAYCALGNAYNDLCSFEEAVECFQSGLKVFDVMRATLQPEDVWKTSFHDLSRSANSAVWRSLLRLEKYDEALCVAEQGRAQDLVDGSRIQYGLQISPLPDNPAETISYLSQNDGQIVFVAQQQVKINFWIIRKENKVEFRQWNLEDGNIAQDTVGGMVESVLKKIGAGDRVECEHRSLDELSDDDAEDDDGEPTDSLVCSKDALQPLHDAVISPILDVCRDDELIIACDEHLSTVPFSALRDSLRIRIVPSLTVLKLIRGRPEDFHCTSGALLVGDPCLENVTSEHGQLIFSQLPYAKKEVEMIGEIHKVPPLTGAEATKKEVLKQMASVALVHIAAYARNQTGEIPLAPNPGWTTSVPQEEDYLLKVSQLQDVGLRAKLVVLSCGHSGRGDEDVESVVGIAQAFLVAGARSVLVSLWAVSDEATMAFMKCFHQHLVDGESASTALQKARQSLRSSEKFCAVKHWAPFVLIGDDVKLDIGQKESLQDVSACLSSCEDTPLKRKRENIDVAP